MTSSLLPVSSVNFASAAFLFSFRFRLSDAGSLRAEFFVVVVVGLLQFAAVLLSTGSATASSRRPLQPEMTS